MAGAGDQTTDTTPASKDDIEFRALLIDYLAAVAAAKNDQVAMDAALARFKVGTYRLANLDTHHKAVVALFEKNPDLVKKLADVRMDLANRKATGSLDNDFRLYMQMAEILKLFDTKQAGYQTAGLDGARGMIALAGMLRELCNLCGYADGVAYLDDKIKDFEERAAQLKAPQKQYQADLLGKMVPGTDDLTNGLDAETKKVMNTVIRAIGDEALASGRKSLDSRTAVIGNGPGAVTGQQVDASAPPQPAPQPTITDAKAEILAMKGKEGLTDAQVRNLADAYAAIAQTENDTAFVDTQAELSTLKLSESMHTLTSEQRAYVTEYMEKVGLTRGLKFGT